MKVCYSGFNLYNQIISSNDLVIEDFTEFEYEDFEDIIFSHTYIVIKTPNNLHFHGRVHKDLMIEENENIKKVGCVDSIVYLLYKNGNLFRLNSATGDTKLIPTFIHVENPDDHTDYIVDIACGSKLNVAVSKKYKIFNIPNRLDYNGGKPKQVVVGREHSLILNFNGDVYSFGCGIRGQLGHGTLENEENPKLIEALAGVKIIKIAAGGWHSCALSVTGDLYAWGWNSNGQLALSNKENPSVYATPQPIYFEDDPDCIINDVACGSKHTIVSIGSCLYGAGWNKYHQLGKGTDEDVYEFKVIKDFAGEEVISLQCGPWCTAVTKK